MTSLLCLVLIMLMCGNVAKGGSGCSKDEDCGDGYYDMFCASDGKQSGKRSCRRIECDSGMIPGYQHRRNLLIIKRHI